MSKYSKINIVYFMQKWMDSVPGQTFLNYAYSWGAAVVILGTLFKLTHLDGADVMLFIGMGTEVFVFFISAFDRPFDKSSIDMALDNHMDDNVINSVANNPMGAPVTYPTGGAAVIGGGVPADAQTDGENIAAATSGGGVIGGGSVVGGGVIGGGYAGSPVIIGGGNDTATQETEETVKPHTSSAIPAGGTVIIGSGAENSTPAAPVITPAPAVSQETAEEMETVTKAYIERLSELNEMLEKVGQLTSRLSTDSEEMENLNRTLTGIARVYEMQLKSASQQITTQDSINEQTRIMAEKIIELNSIYTRMIEAMTVNMGVTPKAVQ